MDYKTNKIMLNQFDLWPNRCAYFVSFYAIKLHALNNAYFAHLFNEKRTKRKIKNEVKNFWSISLDQQT